MSLAIAVLLSLLTAGVLFFLVLALVAFFTSPRPPRKTPPSKEETRRPREGRALPEEVQTASLRGRRPYLHEDLLIFTPHGYERIRRPRTLSGRTLQRPLWR